MKRNAKQQENLKRWIKVLKTTKKKQITGSLRNEHGYCCLGIAAECVLKIKPKYNEDRGEYFFGKQNGTLSRQMRRDLGINADLQETLLSMNDIQEASFEDIGNFLKEQL